MGLAIDVEQVSNVLLADGWHGVVDQSFRLDAYEYLGQNAPGPSFTMGATWKEKDGAVIFCPMTAILAVKTAAVSEKPVPWKPQKKAAT